MIWSVNCPTWRNICFKTVATINASLNSISFAVNGILLITKRLRKRLMNASILEIKWITKSSRRSHAEGLLSSHLKIMKSQYIFAKPASWMWLKHASKQQLIYTRMISMYKALKRRRRSCQHCWKYWSPWRLRSTRCI